MEKKFYEVTFLSKSGHPTIKHFMFYDSFCEDDIDHEIEKYGVNSLNMGSFSYEYVEVTDKNKQVDIINEMMNKNSEKIVSIRNENTELGKLRNKILRNIK